MINDKDYEKDYEGQSNLAYFESLTRKLEEELREKQVKEELLEELVKDKQTEIDLLKDNLSEINSKNRKIITIKVPEKIKTIIHQYLIYFKDYVFKIKGETIRFDISSIPEGLNIVIDNNEYLNKNLDKWFNEYIDLVNQNFDNLVLNYEIKTPSDFEVNQTISLLQNQVSLLKRNLNIEIEKLEILKNENRFLREISLNLSKSITIDKSNQINASSIDKVENLKLQIARGELLDVVKQLLGNKATQDNNKKYNHLIMIYQEITRINLEANHGKITFEQKSIALNRITHSLLETIDK